MTTQKSFSLGKIVTSLLAGVLIITMNIDKGYSQPEVNSAVFGTVNLARGMGARLHFINLNTGPSGSVRASLKFFDITGSVLDQYEGLVIQAGYASLDLFPPVAQQVRAIVTVSADGTEARTDFFLANLEVLRSEKGPADHVLSPVFHTNEVNSGTVEEAKQYAEQAEAAATSAATAKNVAQMAAADAKASADRAEAAGDRAEAAAAKAEACLMR
jgi:hypothetical protein